jgi:predicted DNA-binding transcriptional regulator YafY
MSRILERHLQIDTQLRSGQRQTMKSLSEAVERSERTIRGDISFLKDRFGAPIAWNKTRGYHYTDPSWSLPALPLNQGEVFALTLGAKMLQAYAGSAYYQDLKSAVEQLSKRLPAPTEFDLKRLLSDRVLFRVGATLNLNPEIWQKLEFACQMHCQVKIRYFTATRNAESERILDPYILHFSRTNPYVTGFCHRRQAILDFRVDRIRAIEVLPDGFEVDPAFDPQAHLAEAFQHELGGEPTTVRIWFAKESAPYIRERQWHTSQQIKEHSDGSLTLRFISRGLNEVKRWVLFYGQGAIVHEPPELVEMVREEISTMYRHYEEDQLRDKH